jgi:hypothetical protein
MKVTIALMTMLCSLSLFGADVEGERVGKVRVVPVENTPEPDAVETRIAFPGNGEVKERNPVSVQIRLDGYPLGIHSDFPRAKELRDRREGQSLWILIDDRAPIEVNEAIDDTADDDELDFTQTIEQVIPYTLDPGPHVIRVLPLRSYDECLKGDKVFAASVFYIGNKGEKTIDLKKPYLTYNEPMGTFKGDKPILLDFFVSNTQLSKDGYKVRLIIDGNDKRILTEWHPYYIYGLSKGTHTVELQLLDPYNNVLPGLFDDTKATIQVQ